MAKKKYYQSKADRMDESLGMRRGKESTKMQSYKDRRHESMGMKDPHKRHYDSTMNSPRYMERHEMPYHHYEGTYDMMRHDVGKTVVHDWKCPADAYPMEQESNGSMNYLETKNRLEREDARRIRGSELSQDGSKYR